MDFETFLQQYFWVPIVIGILLIIIVVLILCYCCKCYRSGKDYEYMLLVSDGDAGGSRSNIEMGIGQRMNMEKDKKEQSFRSNAWVNAQFYLRGKALFSDIKQLENIGFRQHKSWFRLTEPRMEMQLIMSMIEKSEKMILPFTKSTEKTLKDMLMLLQHPFICTIHDLDFMVDQNIIVVIYPFCKRGSLKDYIYQSKCLEDWKNKYNTKKQGLNTKQVKCFSKHILMALLYLEERGFPNHAHVHSGNIVIENNICRLMALENSLIGEEPKIYPLIKKKLKKNKASIDVLALGHLIYEMCAGSELNSAHPAPRDLLKCKGMDVIQILNFIFAENDRDYPTLQEIASQDFFSKVPLPELDNYNFAPINFNKEMKSVIKAIKSGIPIVNRRKSKLKRSSSDFKFTMSAPDLQNTQQLNTAKTHPSTRNVTVSPTSQFTVSPPPPFGAPPPPPPPPPLFGAPPPPIQAPALSPQQSQDRGALLGDIQRGTKLKKTHTIDMSAPKL